MANESEINNLISLFCSQIPKEYLKTDSLKKHFSQYGTVTDMNIYPSLNGCIIFYDNHEAAAKAKRDGNIMHNQKLLILWNLPTAMKSIIGGSKQNENYDKAKPTSKSKEKSEEKKKRSKIEKNIELEPTTKNETKNKKTDRVDKPPKKEKTESSKKTKKDETELLKSPASTSTQFYSILGLRDNLIRSKKRKQSVLSLAKRNQGTCPDMCPEKERYQRECEHQISIYEQGTKPGTINHYTAIKQYSRSSADQTEPLPHELRPTHVLRMTMDYLLDKIINRCELPNENLADWYHFIWDRTRAIRKDITQQELCDENVVTLIEQCARFHIFCSERLIEEDATVYDDKINTENLTKCLQTLKYMYSDLNKKGKQCPCEAEFRSYMIYLNMNNGNCLSELQLMREEIRKSQEVTFAIKVFSSLNTNNYVKFFSLVKSSTYLVTCIIRRYFLQMRYQAFTTIVKSYTITKRSIELPLQYINSILGFTDLEHALMFYAHLNIVVDEYSLILSKSYQSPSEIFRQRRAVDFLNTTVSIKKIIAQGHVNSSVFKRHIPHSSFDSNGILKEYSLDAKDQSTRLKKHSIAGNDLRRPHHPPPPHSPEANEQEQREYNSSVATKSKIRKTDPNVTICLKNTRYKKINLPLLSPNSNPKVSEPKSIEALAEIIKSHKYKERTSKYSKINTNTNTNNIPLKTVPQVTLTLPPKISPNQTISSSSNAKPTVPAKTTPSQISKVLVNKPLSSETKSKKNTSPLSQFKFVIPSKKELTFSEEDTQEAIQITGIKRATSQDTNDGIKSKKVKNIDPPFTKFNLSSNNQNRENDFKFKITNNKSPTIESNETNRFPLSLLKTQPEKGNSSAFLKQDEKESLKELKRKKMLEEVDLLSSKEMKIMVESTINELLIELSTNIIEEENKIQLELERNKKIEIIRKKIELHKLRFFFEKWRNYTVLMKDKYKRESFPAWVCTNKEYIMECPNSLDLRKNSLHVDQIKDTYPHQMIIDIKNLMYELIKNKISNLYHNLPDNIYWDILIAMPINKDCNLLKTWLMHMFTSLHPQSTEFKNEKFKYGLININILIKEYLNIRNEYDLKVSYQSFLFYYNTNMESPDEAVERYNKLFEFINDDEDLTIAFILSGEISCTKKTFYRFNLSRPKLKYKIFYLNSTNYVELYNKVSISLQYLAASFSINLPFYYSSISEFFEKFFFHVLGELLHLDAFIEISRTNINYLIKVYNSLIELFISHLNSRSFFYLCIDFNHYKNNYAFIKNPALLIEYSMLKSLEKNCKKAVLNYFSVWPPKNFQELKEFMKTFCVDDITMCHNIIRYIFNKVDEEFLATETWENLDSIPLIDILYILVDDKLKRIISNCPPSVIVYKEENISNILKKFVIDELAIIYNHTFHSIKPSLSYDEEEKEKKKLPIENCSFENEKNFTLSELQSLYDKSFK